MKKIFKTNSKKPGHAEEVSSATGDQDEASDSDTQDENFTRGLSDLYEKTEQGDLNMEVIEHQKRSMKQAIFMGFVVFFIVLLGASMSSWYVFRTRPQFSGENIQFGIESSEKTTSGAQMSYIVNFANFESVALSGAQIQMRYPDGFVFHKAFPDPTLGNAIWDIGNLEVGENGRIEIIGRVLGKVGEKITMTAIMDYRPSNASLQLQIADSIDTFLEKSALEIRMEAFDSALIGSEKKFFITYKNLLDEDIRDIQIRLHYPEAFSYASASPLSDEGENIWLISELGAKKEGNIEIKGSLNASEEVTVEFSASILLRGQQAYYEQTSDRFTAQLLKSDLIIDVVVNGNTDNSFAAYGDKLNYALVYENNTGSALENVKLSLVIDSRQTSSEKNMDTSLIDWSGIVDNNVGKVSALDPSNPSSFDVRSITWDKNTIPLLGRIEPSQKGQINLQIPLKSKGDLLSQVGGDIGHLSLESYVETTIAKIGTIVSETKNTSKRLITRINSDLLMASKAYYFDEKGNAVGKGVMPPKVGEETTYVFEWILSNSLHEISDIQVSGTLPGNVAWINEFETSAGDMTFQKDNRTLDFLLNKMPLSVSEVKILFRLTLKPEKRDAKKVLALLSDIVLTAQDTVSGGKIVLALPNITTGSLDDAFSQDKGVVSDL